VAIFVPRLAVFAVFFRGVCVYTAISIVAVFPYTGYIIINSNDNIAIIAVSALLGSLGVTLPT
jgi:flagellar motor switch protein FliM